MDIRLLSYQEHFEGSDGRWFVGAVPSAITAPLLRRTYNGELHTWIASGTGGPGGADLERFMNEQGDELAGQMLDACGEDVAAAIRRGAAMPAPAITSGGEASMPTPLNAVPAERGPPY